MKRRIFMATLIVGIIIAAVIFLAAGKLYRDKKSGRSSCGGSCAGCPGACPCHTNGCRGGAKRE